MYAPRLKPPELCSSAAVGAVPSLAVLDGIRREDGVSRSDAIATADDAPPVLDVDVVSASLMEDGCCDVVGVSVVL